MKASPSCSSVMQLRYTRAGCAETAKKTTKEENDDYGTRARDGWPEDGQTAVRHH